MYKEKLEIQDLIPGKLYYFKDDNGGLYFNYKNWKQIKKNKPLLFVDILDENNLKTILNLHNIRWLKSNNNQIAIFVYEERLGTINLVCSTMELGLITDDNSWAQ